jgi:hypothetical protein
MHVLTRACLAQSLDNYIIRLLDGDHLRNECFMNALLAVLDSATVLWTSATP